MAQERGFSTVLPELQYSRHCVSEISLQNLSARRVDVEVIGHRSTGALVGLADRESNRFQMAASEKVRSRLEVTEDDVAWAQIVETVPGPRLQPAVSVRGKTECVDGKELLSETRELAAVSANPHFTLNVGSAPPVPGEVLLVVNSSDRPMLCTACYSAGHLVSNGKGQMTVLCSQTIERSLAPYQSWRIDTSFEERPLVKFRAAGSAVAMQLLRPSAMNVRLFRVESTIRFDEPAQ